jgi:hypothetical protein
LALKSISTFGNSTAVLENAGLQKSAPFSIIIVGTAGNRTGAAYSAVSAVSDSITYNKYYKSRPHIRALLPALAVKFNISPGRWQHFRLWPLFLQREKGKRTEMTGTQHVGTIKHQFLHKIKITIKMVLVIFHYLNNVLFFAPLLCGSDIYRQQAVTASALA